MSPPQQRALQIDAFKFVASQFIVLHHLIAYGPISDAVTLLAPQFMAWLFDHSRMAVQVFLVLGGYLAAKALSPQAQGWRGSILTTLLARYRRLVLPYLLALLLAIVCAALARTWLNDPFIPAAPNGFQLLAHALLLQTVLGQDSLSAGVWYIAIDFQLFALMTLLLWLGQNIKPAGRGARSTATAPGLVLLLMLASLFYFNTNARWDSWGLYFFGAYGLGAAAYWIGCVSRPGFFFGLLAVTGSLSLLHDFRERLLLALAVALVLAWFRWKPLTPALATAPSSGPTRVLSWLGEISYSLFLLHFPVLLLGNALYAQSGWIGPLPASLFLILSWAVSLLLAALFQRWVEAPLHRLLAVPARQASRP
ncbi:MAG: acyltransferase [Burkholderiaceae bacterium]